jgi:hypothetical protein
MAPEVLLRKLAYLRQLLRDLAPYKDATLAMGTTIYVGMAVTGNSTTTLATGVFDNVSVAGSGGGATVTPTVSPTPTATTVGPTATPPPSPTLDPGSEVVIRRVTHLWWEDNLFGLPQLFTWGLPTDITPAPYRPMSPCDESFVCNAFESWGWNFTNVGLLHDFTSWFADETYSLMVVWMPVEWASYKSINDLFDGAPSGFSYASHARIPGHGR